MKALVCKKYGQPQFHLKKIEKPLPGRNEVVIKL